MVLFDLNSEFPLLKGIERQIVFIPEHGYGILTGTDYGKSILLFDSTNSFPTKVDPRITPEDERSRPISRLWLEGVIMVLNGNPDAQYINLRIEGECITATLRLNINAKTMIDLNLIQPNTLAPYLLKYDTSDPNNIQIVGIYDPEPVLSIQRALRLYLDIPSSKSSPSVPDFDTVPVLYQIAMLFRWITDERAYLESRRRLLKVLLVDKKSELELMHTIPE